MFLPLDAPDLSEVLSYYNTHLFVGSEGDVSVHANAGLGTNTILYALFGLIFDLAQFQPVSYQPHLLHLSNRHAPGSATLDRRDIPWDPGEELIGDSEMAQSKELSKRSPNPRVADAIIPSNPVSTLASSTNSVSYTPRQNAPASGVSRSGGPISNTSSSSKTVSKSPNTNAPAQNLPAQKEQGWFKPVHETKSSAVSTAVQPASSSPALNLPATTSSKQNHATYMLTDLLPHPGYFLAGGVAGFMSRTATAPLDRLKVYLIAQVSTQSEAANALKSGSPIKAMRAASGPLVNACVELWRMGGVRSLFAGKL